VASEMSISVFTTSACTFSKGREKKGDGFFRLISCWRRLPLTPVQSLPFLIGGSTHDTVYLNPQFWLARLFVFGSLSFDSFRADTYIYASYQSPLFSYTYAVVDQMEINTSILSSA
jgi:hypothetical protein